MSADRIDQSLPVTSTDPAASFGADESNLGSSILLMFELSIDLLCVAGVDGYFKIVNPAFTRVLGYDRETLLSTPIAELIHPEDVDRSVVEISRLGSAGSTVDFVNRYLCADGRYVWLQWNAQSLGQNQIYCIARDVTEQQRLHTLMIETQRAALIGGWELDLSTDQLIWTEQTYLLHEVDPQSFDLNLEVAVSFYAPGSLQIITEAVAEARASGKQWDLELEIITAKGNRRSVRAVGRVEFVAGQPTRVFGSFQDITARKGLEEQLLHSQKLEGLGRLAGGVAHDFNNLLTVIVGNVGLVHHLAEIGEEAQLCLDAIQEAADQACHVTGQLLAFARKQVRSPQNVCLANRVLELRNVLERLLGVDATLEANVEHSNGNVLVDPGHFELVLINLVVNARDATGPGGKITIEVRDVDGCEALGNVSLAGRYVEVVVRDNGAGIPDEVLPHVFDPFFTTKDHGKGTGLGLATSHSVVEQNGGQIRVVSEMGKGSAFHLYFPAVPADDAIDPGVDKSVCGSGKTILLVEDEPLVRRVTRQVLTGAGFVVLEAEDGPSAFELASRSEGVIDIIVSDVMLPGMSGRDVVRTLREQIGPVPTLIVSGYIGEETDELDLCSDGDWFLQKPFTPDVLLSKLASMLARDTTVT